MENETELDFCLLIPCYNNIEGLKRSLKTIQYNVERHLIVIVDDGSDQKITPENFHLLELQSKLHIINLPVNKGIVTALNCGLEWIIKNKNPKYIARLDCGDLCDATRFIKQVGFLNNHTEIGLLGSWCVFKESRSVRSYTYKTPLTHAAIRKSMHFKNTFIHPTVMFRKEVLSQTGFYPLHYPHAEDYALFWCMLKTTNGAILNEYLVTCNISSNGISSVNRKIQLQSCRRIIATFGENNWWKFLGMITTKVRQCLPQNIILWLKQLVLNVGALFFYF